VKRAAKPKPPPSPGRLIELGAFAPPDAPARPVRLWVPAAARPDVPHPALILLDGQNVFGDEGSFAGGWFAHHAVDAMTASTLIPPVVIAVANGGQHRVRELGPDVMRFNDALADKLVPWVGKRIPLRPRVGIGGASLGGLAALRAGLHRPDRFDAVLAMSPSLWFGRRALLRALGEGQVVVPAGVRFYVDAGALERGRMFRDAELFTRLLTSAGLDPAALKWRPDRRGRHSERHWRRRLPAALRFLFRREGLGIGP
jgi:enterochelin esterase-like enzyme